MAPASLSLCLLGLSLAVPHTKAVLTQTPAVSVSQGSSAKLSCTLGAGASISSAHVNWLQQKPGNPPRYLLYCKDEPSQGLASRATDRFSATKEASTNTCYLAISAAEAEDEASYYCLTSSGGEYVFGGGTQLTVLGQPKASPTVHLFPPSSEEISSKSKATLVCLLDSFYPGSAQVIWKADGQQISTGVETTKPSKQSDNKYMASSYLSLSASDWKSREIFICQVTHDGKTFEKSLKRSQCS